MPVALGRRALGRLEAASRRSGRRRGAQGRLRHGSRSWTGGDGGSPGVSSWTKGELCAGCMSRCSPPSSQAWRGRWIGRCSGKRGGGRIREVGGVSTHARDCCKCGRRGENYRMSGMSGDGERSGSRGGCRGPAMARCWSLKIPPTQAASTILFSKKNGRDRQWMPRSKKGPSFSTMPHAMLEALDSSRGGLGLSPTCWEFVCGALTSKKWPHHLAPPRIRPPSDH